MTQLIGAICEDSKTTIAICDRMVSMAGMTLTFEKVGSTKAFMLTSHATVLVSGDLLACSFIKDVRSTLSGKETIKQIAERLTEAYKEARGRQVIDEILFPVTGIRSFEELHDKHSSLDQGLLRDLHREMGRYDLGVNLLLAGYDTGARLFEIAEPGTFRDFEPLSFCCIGIGSSHAETVFASYGYTETFAPKDALYIAFAAKKSAERAGGVGTTTDIVIINEGGAIYLSEETIAAMNDVWQDKEAGRKIPTEADSRIAELKIEGFNLNPENP